jgi:3'(2'), 5'-bisphosphate nucleotidase
LNIDIDRVCDIARAAGAAIMEIYDGDHAVEFKDDKSPLTAADKAAHRVIVAGLEELTPDIPILSEEGRDIPYEVRKKWSCFWLVDPLDGTKEFIKRNGEFTVNIALIERQKPVFGVVYVPVPDTLYWGGQELGAWRQEGQGPAETIRVREPDPAKGLTVVMSRSHPSPELEEYLKTIQVVDAISVGSSLKLCTVAEGRADLYPRLGPTMEWDTAAGQAVVEGAGGGVKNTEGTPLAYNKQNLLNPYFIVKGSV